MKYFGIATLLLSIGCFEPAKVVVGVEDGSLNGRTIASTSRRLRKWERRGM